MLNVQTRAYDRARAIVEDEAMRIERELREFRDRERGPHEISYKGTLGHVRTTLRGLGLPEIVLLGVEARIAEAQADEVDAGPNVVSEILQQIGCDFVALRDWRPD